MNSNIPQQIYSEEEKARRKRRIFLFILGGFILVCPGLLLASADILFVPKSQLASTYGIMDKEKSALVISNRTDEFYILDVTVAGAQEQKFAELIPQGGVRTFEISPGAYNLSVHYSDRSSLDNLAFMTWYVSALKKADFEVKAGRAARFTLKGGDAMGIMYDPPDLEDDTRETGSDK